MTAAQKTGYAISGKIFLQAVKYIFFLLVCLLVVCHGALIAQSPGKVYHFDVNGLKLNMNLDEVIKLYNVNNIKVNKDVYGIINGYEIRKRISRKKVMVLLNFTGEKRLYRIHYSSLHDKYRYRSQELFASLLKKYGKPWTDNTSTNNPRKNIYACWGTSCKKYPHTTPILTARIFHTAGRMELMLADNRIFNKDWKLYRQKLSGQMTDRGRVTLESREKDALSK